ncbi:ATP-dependent helicase [Thiomonas sp. FB-Cd]|uniref:ATP-dependent helicase n=1 Tax=Thiomonas sp. FB-Cd TaxID=1158292 RepID=UPI0004DF7179|nr:ATP-dependent helicase [Thiomonas sp. FB-Cd]
MSTATFQPSPTIFSNLNDRQLEAVEHGLEPATAPALLVIAGAGSGKTMTLAARVTRLVLRGADPQRILLLTFSRRAAAEMERRAGSLLHQTLGLGTAQSPPCFRWSGTFHSVGARLLREYAPRIGLSDQFTILDRGDAEDLLGIQRQQLGLAGSKTRFPLKGTCLSIYSRAVNSQLPLGEVLLQSYPWCVNWEGELKQLFKAYVQEKQSQHVLDYDDLLLYWWQMMGERELAVEIGQRFDHVLVDEYQDTNRLQARIILLLKPDGRGVTVVGDDAQSIYSFRAAEVRNILDFPQQYPVPARVVTLERNYRSTQPILEASNAVIALAHERYAKQLWTDRASSNRPRLVTVADEASQARWVADQVLAQREDGMTLKSQAVLFRTAHHSAALELELTRRNIPFVKFGGLKFLEAAHVKDLLSILRGVQNPRNQLACFRVAQLIPGMGPANARKLIDAMAASADPAEVLLQFKAPPAAQGDWAGFCEIYTRLRCEGGRGSWPDDLQCAADWYLPQMDRLYEDAIVRQADVLQLQRIAASYPSRERFLTELTLDPPEATSDEAGPPHRDEDYLILSTIHSAKGQEWKAVYVLNVVDGCMPSDLSTQSAQQIEEERRLLYVAMTRARQHLELIVPQRFYVQQQSGYGDRHVYASPSRFISQDIAGLFDRDGQWAVMQDVVGPSGSRTATVDLAAKVSTFWD